MQSETIKNSSQEISSLDTLYKASQNHKLSIEDRKAAIDKLQDKYPQYFKNISDEAFLNGKAANSYYELRKAIIEVAKAKAAQSKIDEISQGYLEEELAIKKRMEQANLDYRNAKDTTVFLQGSGMYGGGTYQQVSKAENQASAKARFDKETENLKQVLIKRNKDLEPYLKIVQKTMSLEASLERPSSTPTQKGAYSTKSSGTTSTKSADKSTTEKKDPLDAINPATGNTYKSELESLKAAQAAQIQAKLDQLNLEDQINSQAYEREKEWSDKKKAIAEAEKDHKMQMMYLIADAFQIAAEAAGESTAAGKALAVASTVISTWQTAQKAYESAFLPVPTIHSPILGRISQGIAIATGLLPY